MNKIGENDNIFMILDFKSKWVRNVAITKEFHSHKGILYLQELIGKEYGHTYLLTPSNRKIAILPAYTLDKINHMRRESQIIYPEDIGLILTHSLITQGSNVLEAGTGSGTVTSYMAKITQSTGKVNTFDIRPLASNQAIKNIELLGVKDFVNANQGNILEDDLTLQGMDFVMLDLGETWKAIKKIVNYIKPGTRVCLYSPVIEQVKKNTKELEDYEFVDVTSWELVKRKFQVKPNATRPKGRMSGHSGYMTFATYKKINEDPKEKQMRQLISEEHPIYSAHNMGFLMTHGNIEQGQKILILHPPESKVPDYFNYYYPNFDTFTYIKVEGIVEEQALGEQLKSLCNLEEFDSIIVDSIICKNFVHIITPYVKAGGVFVSVVPYIEEMKAIHDQLYLEGYRNGESCELIKRKISKTVVNGKVRMFSEYVNSKGAGYLTYGRKVVDDVVVPKQEIIEEFVELDPDAMPGLRMAQDAIDNPEPEPVNYAQLREDEDL